MTRRVKFHNVGDIGIIKETDAPYHTLPPEAWTDGQNIQFTDGVVKRRKGHDEVFTQLTIVPYWLLPVPYLDSMVWIVAGLTAVEAIEAPSTVATITRAAGAYNANSAGVWTGGIFGGIPVLNNYEDVPQFWASVDTTTPQLLQNLTAWPSTYRCKVLRPFKQALVALGITKDYNTASEVYYPNMIKVSHLADPGSVPTTWDETDATKDAIERELTDTESGELLDGMAMGDTFMMYKEGAVHGLQYIGGQFIWRNWPILEQTGIMTTGCVTPLPKDKQVKRKGHFLYTGEDLVIFDGLDAESVVDRKMRKYLRDNIDSTNFFHSHTAFVPAEKEMWFCFPEVGSTFCTKAATYNLVDGTIGLRDLPNTTHAFAGIIDEDGSQELWDAVDQIWDSGARGNTNWDSQVITKFSRGLMMAGTNDTKLFREGQTNQFDGSNFTCFLERKGMTLIGRDRLGQPVLDFTTQKIINRVWPKLTGGPVDFRVGMQDVIDGTVTWSNTVTFDPSTDEFFDPDPVPSGRIPAIRLEANTDVEFTLSGFDVEMELIGEVQAGTGALG